jgi:hypothetical protein
MAKKKEINSAFFDSQEIIFKKDIINNKLSILKEENQISLDEIFKVYKLPFDETDLKTLSTKDKSSIFDSLTNIDSIKYLFYFNATDSKDVNFIDFNKFLNISLKYPNQISQEMFSKDDIIMLYGKKTDDIIKFNENLHENTLLLNKLKFENLFSRINFKDIYELYSGQKDKNIDIESKLAELSKYQLDENLTYGNLLKINNLLTDVIPNLQNFDYVHHNLTDLSETINSIKENFNSFEIFDKYNEESIKRLSLKDLNKLNMFTQEYTDKYLDTYYNIKLNVTKSMLPFCLNSSCKKLLNYSDILEENIAKLKGNKEQYNAFNNELKKHVMDLQKLKGSDGYQKYVRKLEEARNQIKHLPDFQTSGGAQGELKVLLTMVDMLLMFVMMILKVSIQSTFNIIDHLSSQQIKKMERDIADINRQIKGISSEIEHNYKDIGNKVKQNEDLIIKHNIFNDFKDNLSKYRFDDNDMIDKSIKEKLSSLLYINTLCTLIGTDKVKTYIDNVNPNIWDLYAKTNTYVEKMFNGKLENLITLNSFQVNELVNRVSQLDNKNFLQEKDIIKLTRQEVSPEDNIKLTKNLQNITNVIHQLSNKYNNYKLTNKNTLEMSDGFDFVPKA